MTSSHPQHGDVALRKESVDRNLPGHEYNIVHNRVALRKESVDRNQQRSHQAWSGNQVALRKESVDRNAAVAFYNATSNRRSPQGECG